MEGADIARFAFNEEEFLIWFGEGHASVISYHFSKIAMLKQLNFVGSSNNFTFLAVSKIAMLSQLNFVGNLNNFTFLAVILKSSPKIMNSGSIQLHF